ncbi:MAG: hypothetical protein MZV49_09760 [Rhodopseudomonas palustris]|nr:hypothetical protein [Rhodopseudomonas palustris]
MERKGFKVPLLIGGATTSRVHTAVKIAPNYPRAGGATSTTPAARSASSPALLSTPRSAGLRSPTSAPSTPRSREPHCPRQADKNAAVAGTRRAPIAFKIDWTGLHAAQADVHGHRACSTTTTLAELVRLHRLDAVLPAPGSSHGRYPAILDRRRWSAKRRARCSPTRRRC